MSRGNQPEGLRQPAWDSQLDATNMHKRQEPRHLLRGNATLASGLPFHGF